MEPPQPTATPTDGAAAAAEPVQGAQPPAATPPEPTTPSQPPTTTSVPSTPDERSAWMQSKGIDPTDPDAVNKAIEFAYNSEKQMTKATQEASELKKSLTPPVPTQPVDGEGDPAMQEFMQDYRRDKLISSFKETHSDWNQHEPAMVAKLQEQVNTPYGVATRSQLVNAGFMSLEDVYAMAKGSAPVNTEQIQSQAKQEVLQILANTQRAGGGTAQASNSNPQAPTTDPVTAAIRKARGQ